MDAQEFDQVFRLPFNEAASWFRQKLNIPTERWNEMEAEAYAKAFTSAGAMSADLLHDLRKITDKAVAGGMNIREFRKKFIPLVKKYGWQLKGGGPAWRSDLIWRTNIRCAYQAGRWKQFEDAGTTHLIYKHSDSVMHPRPKHVALDETVLPIGHPFWQVNYPPNGFGCHCKAYPATKQEIAESGENPSLPDNWEHAPDAGWNYNVAFAGKKRHEELLGEKLASLPADISAALFHELSGHLQENNDAAFAEWVDDFLGNTLINKSGEKIIKTTGVEKTVWFIEPDIAEILREKTGVKLTTSLITITDVEALHSLHLKDLESGTGRPSKRILTGEDLKRLPILLRKPQAVLYHNADKEKSRGLIYLFAAPEGKNPQGKWVIHVNLTNRKTKRVSNSIRSGGYVEKYDIRETDGYVLLKGEL